MRQEPGVDSEIVWSQAHDVSHQARHDRDEREQHDYDRDDSVVAANRIYSQSREACSPCSTGRMISWNVLTCPNHKNSDNTSLRDALQEFAATIIHRYC